MSPSPLTPAATRTTGLSLPGILVRSLRYRRARSLSALAALTVSATVATALLTLRADLDSKLHHEFRSFGANVIATAPSFTPADLAHAHTILGPDALLAPVAYAVATTDRRTPVVVAGVDFAAEQKIDSWWQLDHWPTQPDDALLGHKAAGFIADETHVTLTYAGHPLTLHGAGRLVTGADEDTRIYIPLAAFETWTGLTPTVLEVQVPGGAVRVNAALAKLQTALPNARIEPVRQLVAGESSIVDKTHSLIAGAVTLIALTVAVSVLATLSASVLERRRDFALMKALGASQRQLLGHFLLEALALSAVALVLGTVLGWALASLIGELNFGTAILPRFSPLPIVLTLNAAIAILAATLPARALRSLEPAALLKGE